MANKNFTVKNGLEVGGQEVVSSSGVVTSAALGGQTLASTDSPTFNNLTLTNDIEVGGDLNLTGDLNITGDVNSLSVTDLDVTDQTITLGAGQVESASGGSGIVVDGSGASILWDETNTEWDFNKSINVTGSITSSGITYMNRTGDGNFINFNSDGSEVGSIETQGNEIVLMSVDRGLRIRKSTSNSIIPVGTARTNLDDTMSLGSSGARFTTLYLSDNILNWGKAGSVTVFNQDGTTADFRVESTGEQHMLFVDGGLNRIGMANSAPNAKLHIDSTTATGDATNPALQIGGVTTYRLGMYTTTEGGVIDNANGDDGLQFHTKNVGEAVRITANGNLQMIGQTSSFASPGFTYHTNNHLYLRGGSAGLILSDDAGQNTIQISDSADYIRFETTDGSERMRITSTGIVDIGKASFSSYPTGSKLNVYADGEGIRLDGTGGTTRRIRFRNAGAGSGQGEIVSDGSLKIYNEDANAYLSLSSIRNIEYQVTSGNGTAGHHIFSSYNTEIMRIDGANNRVGIRTDNPSTHLTVFDTTSPQISLDYGGGTANGGSINFNLINGGVPDALTTQIKVIDDGAYRQHLTFLTKTSGAASSGMTERMRLTPSGELGIGLGGSNPQGRLEIRVPEGEGGFMIGSSSSTSNQNKTQMLQCASTLGGSNVWKDVAYIGHSGTFRILGKSIQSGNTSYGGASADATLSVQYGSASVTHHHTHYAAMNGGDVTGNMEYRYLNSGATNGNYRLQVRMPYSGGSQIIYTSIIGISHDEIYEDDS